jgi:hypothetical protein
MSSQTIFLIVHANSQITFIYSMTQEKLNFIPYTCISPTYQFFQNEFQISIDFNECANIRGHIHTQCTLALISS